MGDKDSHIHTTIYKIGTVSTGNSTQYSATAYMEKKSKKRVNIYISAYIYA